MTAYNDNGTPVATQVLNVGGHAKMVNLPENMPFTEDISAATYLAYSSDRNIVGFQFNGSGDLTMLDVLPTLAATGRAGETSRPPLAAIIAGLMTRKKDPGSRMMKAYPLSSSGNDIRNDFP